MPRTFIKIVITLALFVFLLPSVVRAQAMGGQIPPPPRSVEEAKKNPPDPRSMVPSGDPAKPIATVNIQDGFVVAKNGNTFDIAFSLSNREEIQTSIRYGVRLVADTEKGQVIVDEKTYDEEVTLVENDRVLKRITYTAPEFLSGEFSLYLSSSNQSGFPFGVVFVDKVTVDATKPGITIDPASCTVQPSGSLSALPLLQAAVISVGQTITVTCMGESTAYSVIPAIVSFETKKISAYGEKLPSAPEGAESVVFGSKEKKTFTFTLPRQSTPGLYHVQASLFAGSQVSNSIFLRFAVKGKTATIENVSFDKESYRRGDTAQLSLIWYGTVETKEEADPEGDAPYRLLVSMKNASGGDCASSIDAPLSFKQGGKTTISFVLEKTCKDPVVSVRISEPDGSKVYDTREFAIQLDRSPVDSQTTTIVVGVVVLLAIISLVLRHRKSRMNRKVASSIGVFLAMMLGGMLFASHTHADTYQNCIMGYDNPCYSYESTYIRTTVNLNKSTYAPGETINVTGYAEVLPGPWGGGTAAYALQVNMQHYNASNRYNGGSYNYYAQWPNPRLMPSYDAGIYYWDGTIPKYSYGYHYWGTGPFVEVFLYGSSALHSYNSFTAWPNGTSGPYSILFWTNFFSYNAGWTTIPIGPYELFYSIAEPDNRSLNAGPDMTINHPITNPTLTIDGAVTGDFFWYSWQQIAGPTNPSLQYSYNGDAQYDASGMVPGTYTFRLGGTGTNYQYYYDDMNVTVVPVASGPDLTVDSGSYGAMEIASNDNEKDLTFDVQNIGTVTTGSGFYAVTQVASDSLGNNVISTSDPVWVGSLGAGIDTTTQTHVYFPDIESNSTYYYRHCADKSSAVDPGSITETNEGNNCGSWKAVVIFITDCTDWADNDGDGLADADDPGCHGVAGYDPYDPSEVNPTQCNDGIDNNDPEDTAADNKDPGCHTDGNAGNDLSYDPDDTNELDYVANECSDGVDNDDTEDILADSADPGCHTDGNASNGASYDPNDNDESNKRKPIFIDF